MQQHHNSNNTEHVQSCCDMFSVQLLWGSSEQDHHFQRTIATKSTMAKRGNDDVRGELQTYTAKLHKENYAKAQKSLRTAHARDPASSHVTMSLLAQLNNTPAPGQETDGEPQLKPWPKSYGVMCKMSNTLKEKIVLERVGHIKEPFIKMWKVTEPAIAAHLFEFEFMVHGDHPWPQGQCHMRGVMEKILPSWADTHVYKQAGMLHGRLMEIDSKDMVDSQEFNWSKHGVYAYHPAGVPKKTHVLHKSSGKLAMLPPSMENVVTDEWGFGNNWSDVEAVCLDMDKYPMRVVSTFFELDFLKVDAETWTQFCKNKAAELQRGGTDDGGASAALRLIADAQQAGNAPQSPPPTIRRRTPRTTRQLS